MFQYSAISFTVKTQDNPYIQSAYYPTNKLRNTTHNINKRLCVSAPRCRHQGVLTTEV